MPWSFNLEKRKRVKKKTNQITALFNNQRVAQKVVQKEAAPLDVNETELMDSIFNDLDKETNVRAEKKLKSLETKPIVRPASPKVISQELMLVFISCYTSFKAIHV